MPDLLRTDGSRALVAASDADRDAKVEQLLLDGLDQYFAGRYSDAIHIWTRALFFDRSQPRARAYIDRARSAIAERARRSEQLLHDGVAAFDRGDGGAARQLLNAALEDGASRDEALAVLGRLDRLDGNRSISRAPVTPPPMRRDAIAAASAPADGGRRLAAAVLVVLTLVVAAIITAASWERFGWTLFPAGDAAATTAGPPVRDIMPAAPRRAEIAMARARTLASSGHLRDALDALDDVRVTDPQKPDADFLRTELQRQLLGMSGVTVASSAQGERGRP